MTTPPTGIRPADDIGCHRCADNRVHIRPAETTDGRWLIHSMCAGCGDTWHWLLPEQDKP